MFSSKITTKCLIGVEVGKAWALPCTLCPANAELSTAPAVNSPAVKETIDLHMDIPSPLWRKCTCAFVAGEREHMVTARRRGAMHPHGGRLVAACLLRRARKT